MTEDRMLNLEKQDLFTALDKGREALRRALEGVDENLAVRKPASGGWSILECVEHVVVAEGYLLGRLQVARARSSRWHRASAKGRSLRVLPIAR